MRNSLTLAVVLALVLSAFSGASLVSADEKQMTPEMKEMMEKWQAYATPAEGHQVLQHFIGDWDYTLKWWNAPGTEPENSTGETEVEWILNGRFIQADVEGMSMGQKFEGMGIIGYDNAKKEYQNVWIDNMGTGMMTGTGQYDAGTKTMTEKGTYTDPMTGQDKSYTGITKIIDNDNHTYELYTPGPDGKEFRMMEIMYTRDKD